MYLYGASGHAKVIFEIIKSMGRDVSGLFDDDPTKKTLYNVKVENGVKIVGGENFPLLNAPLIISIGNNRERAEIASQLKVEFGTVIHQSAIISPTAVIGRGTAVLHGSVIQADVIIGEHVLINTAASIDHECKLGNYVHISPHTTLCGNVHVGEGTHIGAGAIVIPNLKIGKWCKIGAGAVVVKDIPDFATVVGNPARILDKLP